MGREGASLTCALEPDSCSPHRTPLLSLLASWVLRAKQLPTLAGVPVCWRSANILLSRHGSAKIGDIGMARVLNRDYLTVLSGLGTFAWR